MVDGERIRERLARLGRLLALLEDVRDRGRDAYLADERLRLEAERELQLVLQICIDVGAHLLVELELGAPTDNADVFARLRDGGALDPALAARLADAARLRNVLVHEYVSLDDERVFEALGELDDVRAFAAVALTLADR